MTVPAAFRHFSPISHTVLAENAIDQLEREIAILGCSRAMLVCGGHIARSQLRKRVVAALGTRIAAQFDGVVTHAAVEAVEEAVNQATRYRVDVLVALGGGSAIDSAKGIAMLLAEGGPPGRHAVEIVEGKFSFRELHQPKVPVVAIPTTLSGAELTGGCSLTTKDHVKLLFRDPKLIPRLVVLDPVANLEVPPAVLAPTGINALAHCLEGLYSLARDPISSAFALAAIPILFRALPEMVNAPSDVGHRSRLLTAANLAGRVTVNARTAIHHVLCHCIGAATGIPHGVANTIMLSHVLRFNLDAAAGALSPAVHAIGIPVSDTSEKRAAEELVARLIELVNQCGIPSRLRDVGVAHKQLIAVAEHAMREPGIHFNPKPIRAAKEILPILEAAW